MKPIFRLGRTTYDVIEVVFRVIIPHTVFGLRLVPVFICDIFHSQYCSKETEFDYLETTPGWGPFGIQEAPPVFDESEQLPGKPYLSLPSLYSPFLGLEISVFSQQPEVLVVNSMWHLPSNCCLVDCVRWRP